MSISTTAEPRDQSGGALLPPIAAGMQRLLAAYAAWRMEQSAIAILESMSDRELKDIGMVRSDIGCAVRCKPACRGTLVREC